jgi:hypothetical protein
MPLTPSVTIRTISAESESSMLSSVREVSFNSSRKKIHKRHTYNVDETGYDGGRVNISHYTTIKGLTRQRGPAENKQDVRQTDMEQRNARTYSEVAKPRSHT